MSRNVISTSPSSTEILYALGVEPVAVSHACDFPPEAADLPTIDVSKVDAEASADRHEQVRAATANGHLYQMDAERIDDADPDLIVTQGVCGVCAVDDVLVDETLADLDADPEVLALDASRLEDVLECVHDVGQATGTEARADELVADLRERIATLEERVPAAPRPRTAVLEWMDPARPAGTWVPDVVDLAGGEYGLSEPGERSAPVEWDSFLEYDPEVLVVAPCGFDAERTREQFGELSDRPGWEDITAVREERVFILDGGAYLTRWTPRLVDAAERLATLCHPDEFGEPPADVVRL
ncbi:ABC transporter substrate-binding protein [Natrialba sp. SSL1]|uniref:ABC transporter substrate-binding protein n=1 Tax=Natrialba sp. SSL1 TaxID=1869245 RepID=UPI0008F8F3D7|nr:ABC transporter substrate-binding protein [Natrialba sp. SSL1]OIB55439.1 cobalamin-binding protein [Natrialba sp. SSL1]